MPSKDEKNRRKGIAKAIRDKQREKAREALPASPLVLREMFDFVDKHLEDAECDHTLRLVIEFVHRKHLDEAKIIAWLKDNGGHCDCEALDNTEQAVSEAVAGYDDLGAKSVQ